jgi:exopolyphosphatase/guanosine-5'-triphosphate,3'-diphosphate pyrophosphatase
MNTFAAIDIGSNGARLLIKRFNPEATREEDRIKKVMFIRIPLRLGKDVFSLGKISKEREKMMLRMMKGFKQFMKLNDVDEYRACATSAMRDAENGKKILKKIEKQTDIKLEIIKGEEEAQLLFNNLLEKTGSNEGNFAYIDVGGGSTEVSLIHDGVLAESYSYNMGTLRMLSGKVTADTERLFQENLTRYAQEYGNIRIIGSGGNINKLNKLARHSKNSKDLTLAELKRLYTMMQPLSIEEREISFSLREDRADVIIPAAEIFIKASEYLQCESIMVPNISLADSIVDGLIEKVKSSSLFTGL